MSKSQDLHVAAGTTFHLPCKVILRLQMLITVMLRRMLVLIADSDADAEDSGGQIADSLVSEPDVDPAECSRHHRLIILHC